MHLYSLLNAACISYCGCKERKKMAKILKATMSDSSVAGSSDRFSLSR